MNSSIAAVASLYKMDNSFFQKSVGNLETDLATKKIDEHSNPILWMAGHLASVRYHLLDLLGEKVELPWPKLFNEAFLLQPRVTKNSIY